ncbi:30S ribosomal protein S13 [bacterium]|nr:30S ribosomal protein S13 [bacterium]
MMRIANINIPDNKRIEIALTYLYGIGRSLSKEILKEAGINFDLKAKDLSEAQIKLIQNEIEKKGVLIEGDLRRERAQNIKRLKEIGCYRGIRHIKKLPVRGQRTKTNSRTVRGNVKKTMTSGKRKLEKK